MASERKTTTNQRGETKKQKQNDNNRKTSKPQKARPFNQSAVADRIQVREKQRPNRNLRNHRTSISIDDVEILPTKRKTQPVIDRIIETTRIAPAIAIVGCWFVFFLLSPHEIHSLRVMTSDWSNSHRERLHQVASCEAILPAGSITVTISNIFHSFSAFVTSNDHVRQAILHTSSKIRLWRVSTGCHMRCRPVISQETNQRWFPVYFSAVVITFPMFLRNRSTWPFASGQKGLIFR